VSKELAPTWDEAMHILLFGRGDSRHCIPRSNTLPEQDQDTPQVDEAQVIERETLVADYQPTAVTQPGEEALNFPTPLVTAQGPSVLGLGTFPTAPVRRNHLDAQFGQGLVQGVSVVGAVPDEPFGYVG
jgi:hypothetical protein